MLSRLNKKRLNLFNAGILLNTFAIFSLFQYGKDLLRVRRNNMVFGSWVS